MSVTAVIPPYSSPSAFSSIFTPRSQQKPRSTDVIYTLSAAVSTLEKAATYVDHQQQAPQPQPAVSSTSHARPLTLENLRAAVTEASASNAESSGTSHLDGQPIQPVYINIEELARKFHPFNVPPVPVPMPVTEESNTCPSPIQPRPAPANALPMSPSFFEAAHMSWVLMKDTLVKKLLASGWETFRQRMRSRNLRWQIGRIEKRREMWRAISVKRQRKLRMKKHKYKKLMKRTRTLRRKLEK